jgi:ABC-type molybdate transport system permease subunit
MNLPAVLAWLNILLAVPVNWIVLVGLWQISRSNPGNRVLRERMFLALVLAPVVTIFALVFLNNGMEQPPLGLPQTQVLTRVAILALTIPALYWLSLYWGKLRG